MVSNLHTYLANGTFFSVEIVLELGGMCPCFDKTLHNPPEKLLVKALFRPDILKNEGLKWRPRRQKCTNFLRFLSAVCFDF